MRIFGLKPFELLQVMEPKTVVDVAVLAAAGVVGLSLPLMLFDNSLFSYHPSAMSVAFILFMNTGVACSAKFRALGPGPERVKSIWIHALLQVFAFAFALGGFIAIYKNKVIHGKRKQ